MTGAGSLFSRKGHSWENAPLAMATPSLSSGKARSRRTLKLKTYSFQRSIPHSSLRSHPCPRAESGHTNSTFVLSGLSSTYSPSCYRNPYFGYIQHCALCSALFEICHGNFSFIQNQKAEAWLLAGTSWRSYHTSFQKLPGSQLVFVSDLKCWL